MKLRELHLSLLMEAHRHGSVNPVTEADWDATAQLRVHGYVDDEGNITQKGRDAARQGDR